MKSRADHIKDELNAVSGDVSALWQTAQRLLHSKHKAVYDDAESAKLATTFCQFFVEKVNRIRDISHALQSSARRAFAVRPHQGPALSVQPVTIEDVRQEAQLPQRNSASAAHMEAAKPSSPLPIPLWLHLDAYGRIRNPQQTYAKRAVRKAHFKLNRAFKVIQGPFVPTGTQSGVLS